MSRLKMYSSHFELDSLLSGGCLTSAWYLANAADDAGTREAMRTLEAGG